jgi:hypothetical protein
MRGIQLVTLLYSSASCWQSNPILQNNTGVDFSMFTIPNFLNSVIGNNQTATTFRFGSTYEVYTIFFFHVCRYLYS